MRRAERWGVRAAAGLALVVAACWGGAAGAQEIKQYDNPYIFDGILRESPFKFSFQVDEVRVEFDRNQNPKMSHFTRKSSAEIEAEWKAAYQAKREIAPGYLVIGHVFLTQQGHMSFTLRDQSNNTMLLVEVIPDPERGGTNVRSDARVRSNINVAYRRVWYDFSPKGMEPYSVHCNGH